MKKKELAGLIASYLVLIFLIPILFGNNFSKEFPKTEVYTGQVNYSGENAYKNMQEITQNYTNRSFGSASDKACSLWIAGRFKDMGIELSYQEFESTIPNRDIFGGKFDLADNKMNLFTDSVNDVVEKVNGVNVIGISKGDVEESIVIGAHRDISSTTIEGAEDNASGTAELLELARVLTLEPHHYTYIFVSFDGEESQEKGAYQFVKTYAKEYQVKMAVIMDQVGYKDGDTIWFYDNASGKNQTKLWTLCLAKDVMDYNGLNTVYFKYDNSNAFSRFKSFISQRYMGRINTDSGMFIDAGVPAIGIKTISSANMTEAATHTNMDNMDNISVEALNITGQYMERYIRSLDTSGIEYEGLLDSRNFILTDNQFIPYSVIFIFCICIAVYILLTVINLIRYIVKQKRKTFVYIKKDAGTFLYTILASVILVSILALCATRVLNRIPLFFLGLIFIIILIGSIVFLRKNKMSQWKNNEISSEELMYYHNFMLNILFIISFVLYAVIGNIYVAIMLGFVPILLIGKIGYQIKTPYLLSIGIFIIWSFMHISLLFGIVQPYLNNLLSFSFLSILFIGILLWLNVFVSLFKIKK